MHTLKDVERFLMMGSDDLDSAGIFHETRTEFNRQYDEICRAVLAENGLADFSELYQVPATNVTLGHKSAQLFHELRRWVRQQVQASELLADIF